MAKQTLKERLAARRKELSEKGAGHYHLIKQPGTHRFRILPTGDPETDWSKEIVTFYLGKKSYLSPSTNGKPCAIMAYADKLKNSKKEKDQELSKKIRPKKKYVVAALKYTDDKGKEIDQSGVRLLQLTPQAYQELIDLFLDDDEAGDFTDPKTGYDIKITRTGSGQFDTEYSVRACKPTALPKEYLKKTFDPQEMVDKLLPTFEETETAVDDFLNGGDESSEEKPETVVKKKKKKKKSSDA